MDSFDFILSAFEKIFGRKVATNEFEDRLKVHRVAYMLKFLGGDINYDFGWYMKGPYSPNLAQDMDSRNGVHRTVRVLGKPVNGLIRLVKKAESDMELVASIMYLIDANKINIETESDKIVIMLQSLNPQFSRESITEAIEKIRNV